MKLRFDLKIISVIIFTLLIGSIVVVLFSSMIKFSDNASANEADRIVDIIRRAAVQCYALEGAYPPSIDYLAENYEVILDKDKYRYHYERQMSNIMPDIMVISIQQEQKK